MNNGGPAFPTMHSVSWSGMSLRDYFAAHAPEPEWSAVKVVMEHEQQMNPHNDSYKPPRRSAKEILAALKYEYADAMITARGK